MTKNRSLIPTERVYNAIITIRGKKVIIDSDLAQFYGVTTKRLNEQLRRNRERFPEDFVFQLTRKEKKEVVAICDHLTGIKFSPYLPFVFTEHGAVMIANVLNSPIAIQASIQVVRGFIKFKEILSTQRKIAQKIENLERKLKKRLYGHDKEIKILFQAIQQLIELPAKPRKPIGFKIGK